MFDLTSLTRGLAHGGCGWRRYIYWVGWIMVIAFPPPVYGYDRAQLERFKTTKPCPNYDLSRANLQRQDLARANLQGANLTHAILVFTRLSQANLQGADLAGVNAYGVNLTGSDLRAANLFPANLTGANQRG